MAQTSASKRLSMPVQPNSPVAHRRRAVQLLFPDIISKHPSFIQDLQQIGMALVSVRASSPQLQLHEQLKAAAVHVATAAAPPLPLENDSAR